MKIGIYSVLYFLGLNLCLSIGLANDTPPTVEYNHWTVSSQPILSAGRQDAFDDIATKDPSIVFYNKKYHLFYTSKSSLTNNKVRTVLGYVSSTKLEKLHLAKRHDLNKQLESVIIAPQVFYFRPHKLWYLVGHTGGAKLHKLMPVYMTNPDIENVQGWSKPELFQTTAKANRDFWIDFWVICDDQFAHLFYTDHSGTVFHQKTEKKNFPDGFQSEKETVAVIAKGVDEQGPWRIHEASHLYHVKSDNRYLMIVEATRPHPEKSQYWDSRNRFLIGLTSTSLDGPWKRIEKKNSEFLGHPQNLFNQDGKQSHYSQVSHPELIRPGYDERLQIENYQLEMIFQAFDASEISAQYNYHHLPWEISIMRNK
jgi:Glycosyl hydrolase family 62